MEGDKNPGPHPTPKTEELSGNSILSFSRDYGLISSYYTRIPLPYIHKPRMTDKLPLKTESILL